MRNSFEQCGTINYNLQAGFQSKTLSLKLSISTENILKVFAFNYNKDNLPFECDKLSLNGQKIFQILQNKKRYEVNSIRGDIILKHSERNDKAPTLIILPLTKVYEEEKSNNSGKGQPIDAPKFALFEEVPVINDDFDWKTKNFQKGMDIWRKKFNQKLDRVEDDYEIDWTWEHNNGQKIQGSFFGEMRNDIPHGAGIFYFEDANVDRIEGDWKNGKLDGKAISYSINGNYDQSEWKEGKLFGNYVCHFKDGSREEFQHVVDGKAFGKNRKYSKTGALIKEQLFDDGKVVKKK